MLRVTSDGERVAASSVLVNEPPGGVPSATVVASGAAARRLRRGAHLEILTRGFDAPLFAGRCVARSLSDDVTGESVSIEARGTAAVLEDRASSIVENGSRQAVVSALLAPSKIAAPDSPPGDQRELFVALDEPALPLIARLELLAGRLLLFRGDGTIASVDPTSPTGPIAVPRAWRSSLGATETDRPALRIASPDPAHWGEILHHTQKGEAGVPELEILLPEAVSVAELSAAGAALSAVVEAGPFHIVGGPLLLAARPGSWIDAEGLGTRLVTGRSLAWTPASGLSVTLQGGYPWNNVAFRPARPSEPATVVSVDAETGQATVTLALSGLTFPVGVLTATSSTSTTVLAPPRSDDRGLVAFLFGSAHHGVYLGAPLVRGAVDAEVLKKSVLLITRDGDHVELGDGFKMKWKGLWDVQLDEYDFR